jgi:hypothetical protein
MDEDKTLIVFDDKEETKPAAVEPAPSPLLGQEEKKEEAPVAPVVEEEPKKKGKKAKKEKVIPASRFDANGFCYFFFLVGCYLLVLITLGIMLPWVLCWIASYEAKHTYVDGKRLAFDGHGSQLIGKWLLYILLYIVTATIFGFWIPKKLENWKAFHTHFASEKAKPVEEGKPAEAPKEEVKPEEKPAEAPKEEAKPMEAPKEDTNDVDNAQ